MTPALSPLLSLARFSTIEGGGGVAGHARRAFELAHRARRLCEAAAETASRNRWTSLEGLGPKPRDPIAAFAHACASASIKYPVRTEAAVYAALLNAADCARAVSDRLYQDWLETQPKAKAPVASRNAEHLGGPPAPGNRWVRPTDTEGQ